MSIFKGLLQKQQGSKGDKNRKKPNKAKPDKRLG